MTGQHPADEDNNDGQSFSLNRMKDEGVAYLAWLAS